MRYPLPITTFGPSHTDFAEVSVVEHAILKAVGGSSKLATEVGSMLRKCIDVVIDTPVTSRCDYEDLDKTEKTYLGTRVERNLRSLLGFPKGKLDLRIGTQDVDIKFTVGSNWMIPTEAVDQICILVAADEAQARCYFGLLKTRLVYLSASSNKDRKRSVSAAGFTHIRWLVGGHPYPANFWRGVPDAKRRAIFSARGGNARVIKLFEELPGVPINRSMVEGIAQQKDYMKRLRKNGGARDELMRRGILLLSGKYNAAMIKRLGLPHCDNNSFIATKQKS
jgi:hypothetical protein